jgi:hypothetical protein
MSFLTTTDTIVDYVLEQAGEVTDGTSKYESAALSAVNRAYLGLITSGGAELDPSVREDWEWAKKHPPGSLILAPFIEASTVAVTLASTAITFASAPVASMAGWHFRVTDDDDVFRILTHTAGAAAAVLGAAYTGDTDATASYKLMKLEYDLTSSVLRLFSPMRKFSRTGEINGIDLREMESEWPIRRVAKGTPTAFAIIQQTSAGLFKVRFNKYVDADTLVEYEYIEVPSALTDSSGSTPIVPIEHRILLGDWGLYNLLTQMYEDATLPAVVERTRLRAINKLNQMASENRRTLAMTGGDDFGRILPREDYHAYRHLLTEGGLEVLF